LPLKIVGLVVVLVAGGCAAPSKGGVDTPSQPDLSMGGVGGNGADGDMSLGPDLAGGGGGNGGSGGGGNGGSGGAGGSVDMAKIPVVDMAKMSLPDLAVGPDMAMCKVTPPVAGAPCSEFPQCGCAANQNCDVTSTSGMTTCEPVGTTAPYDNCNADGQCEKGYSCVGGVCKPFCGATSDCPGSGRSCESVEDGNGNAIPGAKICSLDCNPLNPQDTTSGWSACGPNVNCGPGTQAAPTSDCYGPADTTKGAGANCGGTANDGSGPCAPGFECIGSGTTWKCYQNCRVGVSGDCPSGKSCRTLSTAEYVGTQQYGYCN
jgi:hypothetical protein